MMKWDTGFQSTLSKRRATWLLIQKCKASQSDISIHALQAESDYQNQKMSQVICEFQSTLSKRRATDERMRVGLPSQISIHALQAESDFYYPSLKLQNKQNFNPRSPSGERRLQWFFNCGCFLFQSTLSKRRATQATYLQKLANKISIHALQAESDSYSWLWFCYSEISIHALQAESDHRLLHIYQSKSSFQSTLSKRRATGG